MFAQSYQAPQLIVLALIAAVDLVALALIWRSPHRPAFVKALWTAGVVLLPLVGAVGFFINQLLGAATTRLGRRSGARDARRRAAD